MSSDLKIEIFAYYCFGKSWSVEGRNETMQNILEIYGDECLKDNSYSEACDYMFLLAVHSRFVAFSNIYLKELNYDNAINWRSLSDCYDHVTRVCDRNDLFGHLTIFERMFSTCAYVMYLCSYMYMHCLTDVVNYGHIIWAMYFDKYTKEFYEEGGWNELKIITERNGFVAEFLIFLQFNTYTESYRCVWKEASVNYIQYKKTVKYDISKYKHNRRIHVSKLWVKFHIEHFEEYIRIPLSYEDSVDSFEIEMLLKQSQLIYDCFIYDLDVLEMLEKFQEWLEEFQGKFCSNGRMFSKMLDNGEVIRTHEDLWMKNLNICETVCNEFSDSRNFLEKPFQSECPALSEKIAVEIIDETKNVKKNYSEMEMLVNKSGGNLVRYSPNRCKNLPDGTISSEFDSDIENSSKIGELNYKITNKGYDNESEKYLDETPNRNEKRQSELLNERNASYSNHNDETDSHRKNPQGNLPIPIDFNSRSDVTNSPNNAETSNIQLQSSNYTQNEGYSGTPKVTCVLTTNEMSISQCERNVIPKKISTSKNFLVANDFSKSSDSKKTTNKEINNLREEQSDPEMENVLRMILVLGDRKGIQYVCGTSYSGEQGRETSQVKSNKKKKRHTKKSKT